MMSWGSLWRLEVLGGLNKSGGSGFERDVTERKGRLCDYFQEQIRKGSEGRRRTGLDHEEEVHRDVPHHTGRRVLYTYLIRKFR